MVQSRKYKVFRVTMLALVVLFLLLPIVWMVLAAFKTNVDIYDAAKTIVFLPTLENFTKVFAQGNFGAYTTRLRRARAHRLHVPSDGPEAHPRRGTRMHV
jgi:ABC-type glycerol-3-phosphate transport system permease component